MNNTPNSKWKPSVEDILDEYLAKNPEPTSSTLKDWIQQYPQFEKELTELTVGWTLTRWLPEAPDTENRDEDRLVSLGMSVLQNILHQNSQQGSPSEEEPLQGIIAEGNALGYKIHALAKQIDLSVAIIAKLDRRLFHFSSIPHLVVEKLAKLLRKSTVAVLLYLRGAPKMAEGAQFRAEQLPTVQNLEDFFEAVEKDPKLSEEKRQKWMSLRPPN